MTERLGPDALRELFLFEKLSDEQLAWLAERGEVRSYPAGVTVYAAGEPATTLFVLLEGTLSMTVRAGGAEVETVRTDYRGAYAGAFFAYLDVPSARSYSSSVRAATGCRFWELPAADFAWAMKEWFPMATHMLSGFAIQGQATQELVSTRERLVALGAVTAGLTHELNNPATAAARATATLHQRLVALGTVTAGLTHELNNPATAAARATATLHQRLEGLWDELAALTRGELAASQLAALVDLVREATGQRGALPPLSPLQVSDREDELGGWLEEHGVADAWDLAPPLVAAGIDADRLEQVAAGVPAELLPRAVGTLAAACEAESLLDEVVEATRRITKLIGAAKQYTQMDRSPLQHLDVHNGLEATLTMLQHKLGEGIQVVRDYDRSLPKLPAYEGELNQVWTNLIDNAVDAMDGRGTLTVRTWRVGDRVLVEIGDTGPGIPEAVAAHMFEPFYTTKPVGRGTGLGLDICWRIVVQRHGGDLTFTSTPGDTRFQVLLPTGGPPMQ